MKLEITVYLVIFIADQVQISLSASAGKLTTKTTTTKTTTTKTTKTTKTTTIKTTKSTKTTTTRAKITTQTTPTTVATTPPPWVQWLGYDCANSGLRLIDTIFNVPWGLVNELYVFNHPGNCVMKCAANPNCSMFVYYLKTGECKLMQGDVCVSIWNCYHGLQTDSSSGVLTSRLKC